jgi:hypothetical protein
MNISVSSNERCKIKATSRLAVEKLKLLLQSLLIFQIRELVLRYVRPYKRKLIDRKEDKMDDRNQGKKTG